MLSQRLWYYCKGVFTSYFWCDSPYFHLICLYVMWFSLRDVCFVIGSSKSKLFQVFLRQVIETRPIILFIVLWSSVTTCLWDSIQSSCSQWLDNLYCVGLLQCLKHLSKSKFLIKRSNHHYLLHYSPSVAPSKYECVAGTIIQRNKI